MRVSIVIPAYNSERYLNRTVSSLQQQTHEDWECVIVDDGSTDGTSELASQIAKSDKRVRLISQANSGVAASRNRGFAETNRATEAVLFFDHDDLLETDALEILADRLKADPALSAAYGLARYVDSDGNAVRIGELEEMQRRRKAVVGSTVVDWPVSNPSTFDVFAIWSYITTPGQVLIRRAALSQTGPFDSQAVPCDDWDMWLRLSLLGDIAFLNRVVIGWRQHGANQSKQLRSMDEAAVYTRRKLLSSPVLSVSQRSIARVAWLNAAREASVLRMQWARDCAKHGRFIQAALQLRQALRAGLQAMRG